MKTENYIIYRGSSDKSLLNDLKDLKGWTIKGINSKTDLSTNNLDYTYSITKSTILEINIKIK